MLVEFKGKFKSRTIAFCDDELNWHIRESECGDEYHEENLVEMELVYRLGEKDMAEFYKDLYSEYLTQAIEDAKYSVDRKKYLKKLKADLEKFWDKLTTA